MGVSRPPLTLMREDASQRLYPLRERFNGLRFIARTGLQWRSMPHDLPPWHTVYDQTRRGSDANVFTAIIIDLRALIRLGHDCTAHPTTVILDSRPLQSTPESGARAGWDGAKRRNGSTVHVAIDPLGHLLALNVTPANAQDRAQVADLTLAVQEANGEMVTLAYVDASYTGPSAREAAATHGIELEVIKLTDIMRTLCWCRGAGWWSGALAG